jgi:hypothetical protein
LRSLPYDIPFKLSKRSKDVKDQFSSGCGGVDVLGDALEADVSVVQAGDGLDEVVEGSSEPVEPPDDQGVACPDVVEGFVQPGALCLCSACGVGEDPGTACLFLW